MARIPNKQKASSRATWRTRRRFNGETGVHCHAVCTLQVAGASIHDNAHLDGRVSPLCTGFNH